MTDAGGDVSLVLRRWVMTGAVAGDDQELLAGVLPSRKEAARAATKATYQYPLAHYGAKYGYEVRTIKRWIATGRKAGDPPPLDDPGELKSWWSRRMKQRVPGRILELCQAPVREVETKPVVQVRPAAVMTSELETGYQAALDRARENERIAAELLQQAQRMVPPDEGLLEMRQRAWDRAFESLRKAEKDASAVLLASGDLVRWSQKEVEIREKLVELNQGLRSIPVRVATKLGMSGQVFKDFTEQWHRELDILFGGREATDFQLES